MDKKTLGVTVGIFAVIIFLTYGVIKWLDARESKRLSAEAELLNLTSSPVEWYESDKGGGENKKGHTLKFTYVADSKAFTRTYEKITWYDPNKKYKVCRNPADPNDSKLYPTEHSCGS